MQREREKKIGIYGKSVICRTFVVPRKFFLSWNFGHRIEMGNSAMILSNVGLRKRGGFNLRCRQIAADRIYILS